MTRILLLLRKKEKKKRKSCSGANEAEKRMDDGCVECIEKFDRIDFVSKERKKARRLVCGNMPIWQ